MGRLSSAGSRLAPVKAQRITAPERKTARDRGYTTLWDKASKRFLDRNPLCLGCQAVGRVSASALTDHIVPHKGDSVLFWSEHNWQASCKWHHDVVKQLLERMFASGDVTGEDLRLDSERAIALTRENLEKH